VLEAMEEQRLQVVTIGKYNALKAQNDKIFAENRTLKLEKSGHDSEVQKLKDTVDTLTKQIASLQSHTE